MNSFSLQKNGKTGSALVFLENKFLTINKKQKDGKA